VSPPLPRSSRRSAALLLAGATVGFAVGRGLPPPEPVRADRPAAVPARAPEPEAPAAPRPADPPAPAAVREALLGAPDPEALVGSWIDAADRDELASGLRTFVGYPPEVLADVRDLHGFAHDLLGIAAAGLVRAPTGEAAESVHFGTRLSAAREAAAEREPSSSLPGGAPRVFGVFPLAADDVRGVLVKWYRADAPDLLTFRRLPVRNDAGRAFVRLDRPQGWSAGDYRLEIYSEGEHPELLASGGFAAAGGRRLVATVAAAP